MMRKRWPELGRRDTFRRFINAINIDGERPKSLWFRLEELCGLIRIVTRREKGENKIHPSGVSDGSTHRRELFRNPKLPSEFWRFKTCWMVMAISSISIARSSCVVRSDD